VGSWHGHSLAAEVVVAAGLVGVGSTVGSAGVVALADEADTAGLVGDGAADGTGGTTGDGVSARSTGTARGTSASGRSACWTLNHETRTASPVASTHRATRRSDLATRAWYMADIRGSERYGPRYGDSARGRG
jgi:hypothetical protein